MKPEAWRGFVLCEQVICVSGSVGQESQRKVRCQVNVIGTWVWACSGCFYGLYAEWEARGETPTGTGLKHWREFCSQICVESARPSHFSQLAVAGDSYWYRLCDLYLLSIGHHSNKNIDPHNEAVHRNLKQLLSFEISLDWKVCVCVCVCVCYTQKHTWERWWSVAWLFWFFISYS